MPQCHACLCLLRSCRFGLVTQRPLFSIGERARCVTRPNNCWGIDYPYCRSPDRQKNQHYSSTVRCLKIQFHVILLRKAKWKSVVSPIDPNQGYIAIMNKWRYNEQEKMIKVLQKWLLNWLLLIWHLPPELTRDGIKAREAISDFYS